MKGTLFTDGGSRGNPGPAAIGYVLNFGDRKKASQGEYVGVTTNNCAEYKALIAGLMRAQKERVTEIEVYMDSELIVRQMIGRYRVKTAQLVPLHKQAQDLVSQFLTISFNHVRREKNKEADALVNKALDEKMIR